ncbi:hypothetical protein OCJ35_02915 [Pluralibacter gergoviae]|uniref:hypothetical protein n=1 Tax=Pluralibacter gergoviae TaxID=61647 RepID=UPI000FDA8508|nr:hypothetical protein [Pluralibacter gergoviae]MCK1069450.1 hypothetical protein [Pluralibacter gergoviae]MCV7757084.1 hypothetical protein [Pluralibacter gergoviae]
MRHVGFMGGSSIVELGSPSEMIDFFVFLKGKRKFFKDEEIVSRLYNKYVRLEQLDQLDLAVKSIKSSLSLEEDKYLKYLSGIETCIESAKLFYNSWSIYQPLKVAVTDTPYYIEDKNRPLEQYDELDHNASPFWLR